MDTATVVQIVLAVGPLLPLLVAVVQQPNWSPRVRSIASVVISILAGTVTYVADAGLDFSNPPAIVAVIVGTILASNVAYKTIWQPTGVAPAIEYATSPTAPSREIREENPDF